MVAAKADGEAVGAVPGWPAVLSVLLLSAGDATMLPAALLHAAGRAIPDALLLLSAPSGLPAALLFEVAFFPVAGSLLTRVAAVALNRVGFGAGSLNTPGLAAVRVAVCFCSLQALSLARMSPSAARDCAGTVPVRSALCTPGLTAVAGALLTAADMVSPLGVCS